MAQLNFDLGNTLTQSLRAAPSKYDRSKIRFNFEQSEGQRIAGSQSRSAAARHGFGPVYAR